ncbi:MAG: NUDIX domain-containing protein [Chloroflexi bacterium]|nr:NUDIX domain-containing protein [Chloroflexota bacterium]
MPRSDQGALVDRYSIIPRSLIFVFRGDEVLLIKGSPSKRLWANKYNGIGGHIERGEDALSAARRELAEETGLRDVDLRLAGTVMVDADEARGIGLFVFTGSYSQGQLVESSEGVLEWVAMSRLQEYALVEDLYTLLPRIAKIGPCDPPFSALYFYDEHDQMQIKFAA